MLIYYLLIILPGEYDDPKGLSDAIVAIQKLLKVIQDSKGSISDHA